MVDPVRMLTGSIPSAEMGAAHRPFIKLIEPDFLPDACGPRAYWRKGYGYCITGLPKRPHLDIPKREARELLDQWRQGERDAFERIRRRHPKYRTADDSTIAAGPFR